LLAKHLGRATFGKSSAALRVFLGAINMKLVATHDASLPARSGEQITTIQFKQSVRSRPTRAISPHHVNRDRNKQ
jgi:hypothetical protein